MDVCYAGTFNEFIAKNRGAPPEAEFQSLAKPEFVKRKLQYKSRKYLASGSKETVPDRSPFAFRLLEALRSAGGEKGVLTFGDLMSHIENIKPATPVGGDWGSSEPGSDFIFIARIR